MQVLVLGSAQSRQNFLCALNSHFKLAGLEHAEGELPVEFPIENKYVKASFRLRLQPFKQAATLSGTRLEAVFMLVTKDAEIGYLSLINVVNANLRAFILHPEVQARHSHAVEEVAFAEEIVEVIVEDLEEVARKGVPEYLSGIRHEKEGMLRVLELLLQNMGIEELEQVHLEVKGTAIAMAQRPIQKKVKEEVDRPPAQEEGPAAKHFEEEVEEEEDIEGGQAPCYQEDGEEDPERIEREFEVMQSLAREMQELKTRSKEEGAREQRLQDAQAMMLKVMAAVGRKQL